MYDGKIHDFTIFKQLFANFDFSDLRVYVDLGFLGIKKAVTIEELYIPYKSSKKCPLSDIQREINYIYSRIRVRIENAIAKIKSFFILRIENRMRISTKLNDAFHICSMLANYKSNSLIINS